MNTHADKTQENQSESVDSSAQMHAESESTMQFADNRPESVVQAKLQGQPAENSTHNRVTQFQSIANDHADQNPIQKKENKLDFYWMIFSPFWIFFC